LGEENNKKSRNSSWLKRMFRSDKKNHSVVNNFENAPDTEDNQVSYYIEKEKNLLSEAAEIDKKIAAVQRSTRTTFAYMAPLHNSLRMHLKWYYSWHTKKTSSGVHWATLSVFVLLMMFSVASGGFFGFFVSDSRQEVENTQASGITKYARSTGGNWSDDATWSTTSGGAADTTAPTSADDVVFDSLSGGVTINAAAACRSIDLSLYTGTLTHNASITLSVGDGSGGALNFSGSWTYTKGHATSSTISFVSTSNNGGAGWNITFGGKSPGSVTFNGSGGEWTLQDGSTSTGTWYIEQGELNSNDQDISILGLYHATNGTSVFNMGSSEVTVTKGINDYGVSITGLNLTLNEGTSKIIISNGSVMRVSDTFYDIEYQFQDYLPNSSQIRGNITCHDFTATGGAHQKSELWINAGNSLTVTNNIVFAGNSASNRLLVRSSTIGTAVTVNYSGASVSGWQNVDFQDISFSASVDASAITGGSGDCGGNTNLTATTADDWYWNGSGTRNFSDYTYWFTATNGGGTQMASTRPPLPQDNCYIDGNSIDGATSIAVNLYRPCKNLDLTGASAFTLNISGNMVTFYGSVTLNSDVTLTVSNNSTIYTVFSGRGSHTITSAGKSWGQVRIMAYGGTYTLQDDITTDQITLSVGSLKDNGKVVTVNGDISVADVVGLLTSTGSWIQNASGDISNPNSTNSFYSLTIKSGITSTKTKIVWVRKIILESNATLKGSYYLGIKPYGNDFIDISSAGDIIGTIRVYPENSTSYTQKSIDITASLIFNYANNSDVTLTGNWSTDGDLVIFGNQDSNTESEALTIDCDTFNLDIAGDLLLGHVYLSEQYFGKILFGSGSHLIGGDIAVVTGDGDTYGYFDFESSDVTVSGNVDFSYSTVTSGTSSITANGDSAQSITSASQSLNNLTITNASSGGVTFADSATVSGTFTAITASSVITFNAGSTYAFANININGQASETKITLKSSTAGTPFTLSKASGTVSADYLSLKDSTATGGATFYAGSHSTDVSGNTGWTFSDPAKSISNAGGNWSSSSTWSDGIVPTSADDIIATATSGDLTIDTDAVCRSLDLTSYTATLTHSSGHILSIGDATAGIGNNALKFSAGMTYTLGDPNTSSIAFISTSPTTQSITWNGQTPGNLVFNGSGASWQFADGFTAEGIDLTLTSGTLDTNGASISIGSFMPADSANATLTLGASAINFSDNWNTNNATNWVLSSNTATITGGSESQKFGGGSKTTYNDVILNGAGITDVLGNNTFANLTRNTTADKTDGLELFGNQTVSDTLSLQGNSAVNRLLVYSDTLGTARTLTAAVADIDNVDFQDITAGGAASPFGGVSLGDCGGNTNISTDVSAEQTWTNTDGDNWSTASNWTSRVPLPQDNVVFSTINSGQTITIDMPRIGHNVDFSGATNTLEVSLNSIDNSMGYSIYGSLNLSEVATLNNNKDLYFRARSNSSLTSYSKQFGATVYIKMPGATLTLEDDYAQSGQNIMSVDNGSLTAEGSVTTYRFNAALGTTINMGSDTWGITGDGDSWSASDSNISAGSSTLAFTNTGGAQNCLMGANTYNDITITPSSFALNFTGSFTFANMTMSSTGAKTVIFDDASSLTMTGINFLSGSAGNIITISTDSSGSTASLTKASGYISGEYLDMSDITAVSTGATYYAGSHSTLDNCANWSESGIRILKPDGGNWNSASSWYENSVPTSADPVIINDSSGSLNINSSALAASISIGSGYANVISISAGNSLSVSENFSLADGTFISNNQSISLGSYSQSGGAFTAGSSNISCAGDWNNSGGAFTAGSSNVILNGDDLQNITANSQTFSSVTITNASLAGVNFTDNLTVSGTFTDITPSSTITFHSGSTYTLANININGSAVGTRIVMAASSTSSYLFNVSSATPTVSYVDVSYANAEGSSKPINATVGGYDSGNNTNWVFPSASTTIFSDSEGNSVANYGYAEKAYIKVSDSSRNLDPNSEESFSVTVTSLSPASDSETVSLTESGINTGIFINQTGLTLLFYRQDETIVAEDDGTLNIDKDDNTISANYVDAYDSEDSTSDTAVAVVVGPAETINVSPSSAEVLVGGEVQYSASVYDENNFLLESVVTWSVVMGGGTINQSGLFTAGNIAGDFSSTIKAVADSAEKTASVKILSIPVEDEEEEEESGEDTAEVNNQPEESSPIVAKPIVDKTAPIAQIIAPQSALIDSQVSLSAKDSSDNIGIVSYLWDFGDGGTGDKVEENHIYRSFGNFTITLKVSDKAGNSVKTDYVISIIPPKPELTSMKTSNSVLYLYGIAYPNTEVVIFIHSEPIEVRANADDNGIWKALVDMKENNLAVGDHKIFITSAKAIEVGVSDISAESSQQEVMQSDAKEYKLVVSSDGDDLKAVIEGINKKINMTIIIFFLSLVLIVAILVYFDRRHRKSRMI